MRKNFQSTARGQRQRLATTPRAIIQYPPIEHNCICDGLRCRILQFKPTLLKTGLKYRAPGIAQDGQRRVRGRIETGFNLRLGQFRLELGAGRLLDIYPQGYRRAMPQDRANLGSLRGTIFLG